jgi:hypothetical protein
MLMEYILKMAISDGEVCPKGGRPEYRNGPQYQKSMGKAQGDTMRDDNKGACGWGAHKDKVPRYTSIEQKVSALRTWYDEVLKGTDRANFARDLKGWCRQEATAVTTALACPRSVQSTCPFSSSLTHSLLDSTILSECLLKKSKKTPC